MTPENTSCEEAFRRARAQKARIALQQEVIDNLTERGLTELLPPARRVLARLQGTDRLIGEQLRGIVLALATSEEPPPAG
ncbi:hypothetical protein EAH89_15220 [Roseomonas nepalensis]|uniref:Uncharacterized protein n=1 Tax=Muricoccus nepalensis TaxID=1854500 RepID=A0A502FXX0_9PROT|nr:hypothetical protein [Roseomonas nepalensis]TPG53793.1 hypothetical protein EAH89_15220 [Roseomonas nepalensis]